MVPNLFAHAAALRLGRLNRGQKMALLAAIRRGRWPRRDGESGVAEMQRRIANNPRGWCRLLNAAVASMDVPDEPRRDPAVEREEFD